MSNKENNANNPMLSFDELNKALGMDEQEVERIRQEIRATQSIDVKVDDAKPVVNEKPVTELPENSKVVVENGKHFVDITAQYAPREEEPEESAPEEKKPEPVVVKKRIRTFNEIFSDFFKSVFPTKEDSGKEKMRKIVMDISIIAIICCVVAFGKYIVEYQQQIKEGEQLKEQIVETDDLDENQYVEAWQELFAQYPDIPFPEGMDLKYSYLYAVNQDLVGWLKIDNTSLDVQVVQADDNDYYLKRDFYGKTSRYGCPYLDYKNNPKEPDVNTIVYGHHMTDGLMFSQLDKYKTLEGYKESPIIEYSTLYGTYKYKVFAAFISTDSPATDGGFNYMVTDFLSDEKFTQFIGEVKLRSIFNTDVSIQSDDKLITLVTCSHEFEDARLVVMGRMIRENEDPTVNVGSATLNTSVKYPQAWYDKKGIENPYAE